MKGIPDQYVVNVVSQSSPLQGSDGLFSPFLTHTPRMICIPGQVLHYLLQNLISMELTVRFTPKAWLIASVHKSKL